MLKKRLFIISTLVFTLLVFSKVSLTETKTTVEETTTQTTVPTGKRNKPVTTSSTSTTEVVTKTQPRKVLDEEALKKMSNTLCTDGFKSVVGVDKKNVCQGKAAAPDIAYSCVWNKKGAAAYAPTEQGPCSLDFAEHRGSIVITKEDYSSSPPLPYGTEVQCCFRAAKDPSVSNR